MVSLRLTALFELGVGLVPRRGKVLREDMGEDIESFSIRTLDAESCLLVRGRIGWPLPASLGGGFGGSSLLGVCRR